MPDNLAWDYDGMGRGPYPSELDPALIVAAYLERTPASARGMNLGCGGAPFAGWLNIDSDKPWHLDICWDLTQGLPMVPDESFDAVYSEHFMEHISRSAALALAREYHRVLRPEAVVRVAMPDLDRILEDYRQNRGWDDPSAQEQFADDYGPLTGTRGELLNIAMRAWGHTYIYNYEDLARLLQAAGFVDVKRMQIGRSDNPFLAGRETRSAEQSSLIVEARRP